MIGLAFCDFGSFCGACPLFPTFQFFKVTRDKRETEKVLGDLWDGGTIKVK